MRWKRKRADVPESSPAQDTEIARLAARADLIVEQLDIVVKEMAEMLKNSGE